MSVVRVGYFAVGGGCGWWLWYVMDVFGGCGTGKDAFMAASRPTEVLLSYEMDGIITLKSGIPSF